MFASDWSNLFQSLLLLLRKHSVFSVCSCPLVCMLSQGVLFPQLFYSLSSAGLLCDGFQFNALQNLQSLSFVVLFLGLVPNLPIFCFDFLISCSRCIYIYRASSIVFFLFFVSYVYCLIISIVFFRSNFFFQCFISEFDIHNRGHDF